ncbi:unnamed protein product [Rotaria sp. Silwood2]|nr:unnamed protein product [Rotaria sp. Silwood2]
MINTATKFYEELYDIKIIDTTHWNELFKDIATLNDHDREALDRDITVSECHEALKVMPLGRSPGDDGIPIEVWK